MPKTQKTPFFKAIKAYSKIKSLNTFPLTQPERTRVVHSASLFPALMMLICAVSFFCLPTAAASGFLEHTNLFEAGEGGYALYRIPGLIVTARGTLLAYCEARRGNSDWAAMDVLMRRSIDGGKSWGAPLKIPAPVGPKFKNPVRGNANTNEVTCNNPVAIADANGSIHLLFCLEYMRCFYQRSDDDGLTWSKPVEITGTFDKFKPVYDWKVIATGPCHGIQLKNGRLIVPVWLSLGTGANNHGPSVTSVIYSEDHGQTWRGGELAASNTEPWPNPNETTALQLADGRVLFNIRIGKNLRLFTSSVDGATGWSQPQLKSQLLGPPCMGSLARFSTKGPADRNRILFSQPAPPETGETEDAAARLERKSLAIRLSYDEGETWPVRKTLERGPSAYSDLAVLADRAIGCFYERENPGLNSKKHSAYECLTFARFSLGWLTDGNDSGTR
jgi:sialidase-1